MSRPVIRGSHPVCLGGMAAVRSQGITHFFQLKLAVLRGEIGAWSSLLSDPEPPAARYCAVRNRFKKRELSSLSECAWLVLTLPVMPELPEVEIVRRSLEPHMVGSRVVEVEARAIKLARASRRPTGRIASWGPGSSLSNVEVST